jgi:hypothetical protein
MSKSNDPFHGYWHNHPLRPKPPEPSWWTVLGELLLIVLIAIYAVFAIPIYFAVCKLSLLVRIALCAAVATPMWAAANAKALVRHVHRDLTEPPV